MAITSGAPIQLRPKKLNRGRTKLKTDHYINSMFKVYKQSTPESWQVDKETYKRIISDFNTMVRDKMIYDGYSFKLPFLSTELRIHKTRMKFEHKLPIDFKRSYELGYVVRHMNEDRKHCIYRIHWQKRGIRSRTGQMYRFKSCRTFNRLLSAVLQTNSTIDFFEKKR